MMNESVLLHEQCTTRHPFKRISWTAIFVGALVGVGLGFLLNLFGIAIGLTAVTTNKSGAINLAFGGYLGILIAVISSMIAAGYAAGYLGRDYCPNRNLGILYGFTTWSVALLLSAAVTAHLGHYVAAYAPAIGSSTQDTSQQVNGQNPGTAEVTALDNQTNNLNTTNHQDQSTANKVLSSPDHLAGGAFLLFALFFIGAISTCVGAYWAMGCCSRRED